MAVPKKVCERFTAAMKRLGPIVEQQRARDVSEADTVTLVKDLLCDVFGYDKYAELTSELAIRGTYCDLAVKLDDKLSHLIEVKAIGTALNDRHVKQAVDYAANQGVEWVILTNAATWRLYHVEFSKPIDKRLIAELELASLDCRRDADLELLYLFSREGVRKGAPAELRDRQDATSRYLLAALLLHNDSVVSVIRRELRRMVDINVSEDEVIKVLRDEVIKRDTLEGPPAEEATRRVDRAENRRLRDAGKGGTADTVAGATPVPDSPKEDAAPAP